MAREYPDRPIVGVGVVVLGPEGVLLIRRANPPRQGQWSLPGGAQELGETVFTCARREVREETGLDVEILGLIDVVDSIRPDDAGEIHYHYTLIDVVAVVAEPDEPVAGSDAQEVAWMALEDIPGLDLWPETERIINLAVEMAAALGR
ncbi:MAG: NUDIX hydrolase [Alphaproteobacteria bacterium]|jgi:8-oxo-dGTP diphosphatase|nr:NUDIX hydrolase [Alphaproteobacteria bacterium]MBT7943232.1 NUDIX hydrolase [Alphaproteobacteria bacterium]